MAQFPDCNLFTPQVCIRIPEIKTQNEYDRKRPEFDKNEFLEVLIAEFEKTPTKELYSIITEGIIFLSELATPTNTIYPLVWGQEGFVGIYIGEPRETKMGIINTLADLIVPSCKIHFLYDSRYSGGEKEIKTIQTYFIYAPSTNRVKIGKSENPQERLKQLSTGASELMQILATIPENKEKELHQAFKKYRIKGEWFEYSEEIQSYVSTLNAKE